MKRNKQGNSQIRERPCNESEIMRFEGEISEKYEVKDKMGIWEEKEQNIKKNLIKIKNARYIK